MKLTAKRTIPQHPIRIPAARCAALLCMLAALPLHAQSAASFGSKPAAAQAPPATPESHKQSPAATAATPQKSPSSNSPSRHIGAAELPAYVETLTAMLSIRKRETDPFGQYQDPDAKPIMKPSVAATTRRAAPIQATPFSDIIRLIKVTTIMPGEKRFLIGTRSLKQGDRIPLSFRGRNINVEIAAVSSRHIEFRNLENGETAKLSLALLPVGMTPGTRGISAPGMVADRPNAPIDLDGSMPAID